MEAAGLYYPKLNHQITGNTSGTTSIISTGTMYLAGGNNITLSQDANSVTISGGAGGGGAAIQGSGTYTQNTGTIQFQNGNGVTFGLSNNGVMTGSVATNYQPPGAYLTTAMQSDAGSRFLNVGTTNGTNISITLASNNLALSVGNYLTTARASNDAIGLNTAITQNGVSMTANSSGLSLNFPAFLTTAQPPGAYLTTARASNDAIGLNTAATNVTWTVNSSGISLNAGGYLTTAAQSDHSHGNPTLALTNLSGTTASASNGLTLSLSAAAPGAGAAPVVSRYPIADLYYGIVLAPPLYVGTSGATGGSTQFTISGRVWSEAIPFDIQFRDMDFAQSVPNAPVGTGSASLYNAFGFYTLNGNTALSLVSSFYHGHHISQNSVTARTHYMWWGSNSSTNTLNYQGNIQSDFNLARKYDIYDANATLPAGNYHIANFVYYRSSSVNVYSITSQAYRTAVSTSGFSYGGQATYSNNLAGFNGIWSTTTNTNVIPNGINMPGSIATSNITGISSSQMSQVHFFMYKSGT